MKTATILITLLISLGISAQDSLYFEDSKVVALDSINYCTSHYLISFIAINDTFKTVVRKEIINRNGLLIGNAYDIELSVLDSIIVGTSYGEYKFRDNIRSQVSHPSNEKFNETMYRWKIDGTLWWKKYFELRMSTYYYNHDNMGYHFTVENLKSKKAHNKK